MPPYTVVCSRAGCSRTARFKIAARWSDGVTHELKTYALTCAKCLESELSRACKKREACLLASGETLEKPGIYDLQRGQHDYQLHRRVDLEEPGI